MAVACFNNALTSTAPAALWQLHVLIMHSHPQRQERYARIGRSYPGGHRVRGARVTEGLLLPPKGVGQHLDPLGRLQHRFGT